MIKKINILLLSLILLLSAFLIGCDFLPSTTVTTTTSTEETTTETTTTTASEQENRGYYVATVTESSKASVLPYYGDKSAPNGLENVYYSTNAPGGEPTNNENVKIWLTVKPIGKYRIYGLDIIGNYSHVEPLENDVYCIHGVTSDLTVSVSTRTLTSADNEMLSDFGHRISEDGKLIFSWTPLSDTPLRYIEITYTAGETSVTEEFDASTGKAELAKMTENTKYSVVAQAVGYKNVGKTVEFDACYMPEGKNVSFPRIEIITENFVWPTCDTVNSPDKYWGSSIINAEYEQCKVLIYNENNETVYDSTINLDEAQQYLGAKMKIRGNTSAAHHSSDKKYPYKLKLNTKSDLLAPFVDRAEDGKDYAYKDWLLLNYGEESYRLAGDAVADAVGTEWSPEYCYVTLYINGDYRGLYVLSEAVEVGNGEEGNKSRIDIDRDGYLFECDAYWWNEDLYFNTPMTEKTAMFFTFKYPDSQYMDATSPKYIYIKDYMTQFEEALNSDDDSYLEYIDLDSFAKWLLVMDYLCITDGGGANIYLYKEDSTFDSKVTMGPNWDFDSWMGDAKSYSTIRMYWNGCPFYIPYLLKKDSFVEKYNELFYETKDILQEYIEDAYSKIDTEAHNTLLEYEKLRYGTEVKSFDEVEKQFNTWLKEHIDWMENQIK